MTRSVLWDSSAILALLDGDDADHARAVDVARGIASERRPSFITNYIETESHALLLRKLGRALAREWLLTGGLTVVRALPSEELRAKEMLARHTDGKFGDHKLMLADAHGLAVMSSRRIAFCWSTDRHMALTGATLVT